jgi:hypothetical protein
LIKTLFLGLGPDASLGVGDFHIKLNSALEDVDPLAGRNVVGDLSGNGAVVHHEDLEVGGVVDNEGLEAIGAEELGLLVGSETDLGLADGSLEATADAVINTLGLPPSLALREIQSIFQGRKGRRGNEHRENQLFGTMPASKDKDNLGRRSPPSTL